MISKQIVLFVSTLSIFSISGMSVPPDFTLDDLKAAFVIAHLKENSNFLQNFQNPTEYCLPQQMLKQQPIKIKTIEIQKSFRLQRSKKHRTRKELRNTFLCEVCGVRCPTVGARRKHRSRYKHLV